MKKYVHILVSVLMISIVISSCTGQVIDDHEQDVEDIIAEEKEGVREIFKTNLVASEQGIIQEMPDATLYKIDLVVPDDFEQLDGHQLVFYTNQEEISLEKVYFRMFPNTSGDNLVVSNVFINGEFVQPVVEFANSAIRLDLIEPLAPAESIEIEMDFTVQVPREMGGNYGLFGYFEDVLVLDQFFPIIPVYDDEGWNVEVPPCNGDMVYNDVAFFLVKVTAPEDLVLAASGVQVAGEETDGKQVATFAAGPGRDFYLAASPDFVITSQQLGETLVSSYYLAGLDEGGRLVLDVGINAFEAFQERYGSYPYTEMDLVSTPMTAGGMEYSGIVLLSKSYYDPNIEVYGLPAFAFLESATAHEVSHQWFFNMVMSDQIDEPWLDEGMAQYSTNIYYIDTYGDIAASDYRDSWNSRWNRVEFSPIPIGLPCRDYTQKEYSAIIYGRAPLFIKYLEEKMGEEAFGDFLKAYFSQHKWGIATMESFRAVAEETCQCDLEQAFESWVYSR